MPAYRKRPDRPNLLLAQSWESRPAGYYFLRANWHPRSMARLYESGRRPKWPPTVREVVENIEPVNGGAGYPTPTVGGAAAPSCYRVSLLSGALEVTARLKCGDDLDLLVKVLEANRALFAKAERLANEVLTLTDGRKPVCRARIPAPWQLSPALRAGAS